MLSGSANKFQFPTELANKKCVLNIETANNDCFKYAIIASLHHSEVDQHNKSRQSNYLQLFSQYDFTGINSPSTAADIVKFMKLNKDVAITALEYKLSKKKEAAKVIPIYHPPILMSSAATCLLFFS